MVQLEQFEKHLGQVQEEKWAELFNLIPEIEAADTFGIIEQESPLFLKVIQCKIVDKVMHQLESMQLFPLFEWISWREGQRIINANGFDFSSLSMKENCMLLTVIFRLDKFNEGFLVSKFEDGTMLGIIRTLQLKMDRIN